MRFLGESFRFLSDVDRLNFTFSFHTFFPHAVAMSLPSLVLTEEKSNKCSWCSHCSSCTNEKNVLLSFYCLIKSFMSGPGWQEKGRKSTVAKKRCRPRILPSCLWSLEDAILWGSSRALLTSGETQRTARLCNSWSSRCSTDSRSWIRQRKPGRGR